MLPHNLLLSIGAALRDALQQDIVIEQVQPVFGGDINSTFLLGTNAGRLFLKTNTAAPADMFEREYNGLQLLRATNAFTVPKPLAYGSEGDNTFLVMEYMAKGRPANNFWQQFGHGLAAIHNHTQNWFGLDENNYIGTIPQPNKHTDTWAGFYAQQRIMHLMQKALEQKSCSVNDVVLAEKLCTRFDTLFPKEPPALLHGDLWSGNFMAGEDGRPVIYDPAVYYGHREMDIAMTMLFGGFDKQFYHYYNEAHPLQAGWQQRVQLCQLYPLLVHLLLFGGHYYYSVMDVIKQYQ
jgi:fructosamine-3-kinase